MALTSEEQALGRRAWIPTPLFTRGSEDTERQSFRCHRLSTCNRRLVD
ncbi:MAG: hypothetical protein OEZ43_11515 [Gammaproteobacteria bacterium]|nr:hypothetical protein [Gammaproteobacteria bacterium]